MGLPGAIHLAALAGRLDRGDPPALERRSRPVVVAIGGGVHVADEVAHTLRVPFDVVIVEPITVAGLPCAEFGAVAADGTIKLDHELAAQPVSLLTPWPKRLSTSPPRSASAPPAATGG